MVTRSRGGLAWERARSRYNANLETAAGTMLSGIVGDLHEDTEADGTMESVSGKEQGELGDGRYNAPALKTYNSGRTSREWRSCSERRPSAAIQASDACSKQTITAMVASSIVTCKLNFSNLLSRCQPQENLYCAGSI